MRNKAVHISNVNFCNSPTLGMLLAYLLCAKQVSLGLVDIYICLFNQSGWAPLVYIVDIVYVYSLYCVDSIQ